MSDIPYSKFQKKAPSSSLGAYLLNLNLNLNLNLKLKLNLNLTHPSYSLQAVAFSLLLSPPPPDRQYSQTNQRQHRAARLRNRPRIVQHDALVVLRESQ